MFPSPEESNLCYGHEVSPACPRCDSLDTKFCYYNNYSLSQPRYYCKNCCRYWTKGGSLRNIPAGKGCGKRSRRRRQSSSSSRFCQKENQWDHHDGDSSCPEIDLAAVFANYLNGQSLNSSTFNIAKSDQVTKKIEDEGLGQFLEDDMFQFQGLLNDKEIQEILNCSFSDHWN